MARVASENDIPAYEILGQNRPEKWGLKKEKFLPVHYGYITLAFGVFQVYGRILFMFYQQKKKFEQIKEVQNQRKISNNGSSWATHAASTAAAALRYFKIDA